MKGTAREYMLDSMVKQRLRINQQVRKAQQDSARTSLFDYLMTVPE